MRRALFATLTLPLLLAGCAVGPEYEQPQVDLPEEWPDEVLLSDDERADWSNWWQRFDDPALDRLVERALTETLNMQLQYQRLQEARARLGLADAGKMPTLEGRRKQWARVGGCQPAFWRYHQQPVRSNRPAQLRGGSLGRLESQSDAAEAAPSRSPCSPMIPCA